MITDKHARVLRAIAEESEATRHLIPAGWQATPQAVQALAYQLAQHDTLVLIASVPPTLAAQQETLVNAWQDDYAALVTLLAKALFPSLASAVSVRHATDGLYAIVRISSPAFDVLCAVAGFVAPYVASRQTVPAKPAPAEIDVLLTEVLYELEASDLDSGQRRALLQEGRALITRLVASKVRQTALTDFKRAVVPAVNAARAAPPSVDPPRAAPKPTTLPKTGPLTLPPAPDLIEDDSDGDQSTAGILYKLTPPDHGPRKSLPVRPPPPRSIPPKKP
jgi:hypothetical protein